MSVADDIKRPKASHMTIVEDMKTWVANAEHIGDDNYGAAAELMREAATKIGSLHIALEQIANGYLPDQTAEQQFVWAQNVARTALNMPLIRP